MPRSSSRRETCTTGVSAIGHSSSSGFLKLDFALLARIFVLRPVQLVVLLVLARRHVLLVTVRPPLLCERRAAVIEPNLAVALRNHPRILLRRLAPPQCRLSSRVERRLRRLKTAWTVHTPFYAPALISAARWTGSAQRRPESGFSTLPRRSSRPRGSRSRAGYSPRGWN